MTLCHKCRCALNSVSLSHGYKLCHACGPKTTDEGGCGLHGKADWEPNKRACRICNRENKRQEREKKRQIRATK